MELLLFSFICASTFSSNLNVKLLKVYQSTHIQSIYFLLPLLQVLSFHSSLLSPWTFIKPFSSFQLMICSLILFACVDLELYFYFLLSFLRDIKNMQRYIHHLLCYKQPHNVTCIFKESFIS